jgi:hypothetical protein
VIYPSTWLRVVVSLSNHLLFGFCNLFAIYLTRNDLGCHRINLSIDFKPHQTPQAAGHLLLAIGQFPADPEGVAAESITLISIGCNSQILKDFFCHPVIDCS